MDKQAAIDKLERQLEALRGLRVRDSDDPAFKRWQRDTRLVLEHVFGNDTRHRSEFMDIRWWSNDDEVYGEDDVQAQAFAKARADAEALLLSMIDEVREYWPETGEHAAAGKTKAGRTATAQDVSPVDDDSRSMEHATRMDKRYQVFVSSTYADLKDERQRVMEVIMKMDCFPAGMEFFPAADEDVFEFIKKVIDDCDYYLLIIGGRYGSIAADGVSYTEKEHDYAVSQGKKVVALLHREPEKLSMEKSEKDHTGREKLEAFRARVAKGRLVNFWSDAKELPGQVVLSLTHSIKMYPAVGWVRADKVANNDLLIQLNDLRNDNAKLVTRVREFEVRMGTLRSPEEVAKTLSSDATRLLLTAKGATGEIERDIQDSRIYIMTGKDTLVFGDTPREAARWTAAAEELLTHKLVAGRDGGTYVMKLTKFGYEVGDLLEMQAAAKSKTEV